eukprot:COSAG04_NODE_1455_length_6633_cov_3.896689_1_plen_100_part_10
MRWPAGIVLTAEETHPRGGYGSMALAHDAPTVAALASVFHDAVVEECGKELQMRLWRLTGDLRTVDGKPSGSGTFAVRPVSLSLCLSVSLSLCLSLSLSP